VKLDKETIAILPLEKDQHKDDVIYFDELDPGFGIRLRAGGKRTWIVQYRVGAKQRRLTLGTVKLADGSGTLGPAEARKAAQVRLAKVTLGGDPQADKVAKQKEASNTLVAVVDHYLLAKKPVLRPKSFVEVERYLQRYWKPLHNFPIARIERRDITARVGAIAAKHGPVAARHARTALSALFAWAMGEGYKIEANPVIGTNTPAQPAGRDRVLSDDELVEIWNACKEGNYGRIVRLLIVTGQRRSEVGGMCRSELDLDRGIWFIPAARTKNKRPHVIPLAPLAVDIIKAVPEQVGRDCLFGEGPHGYVGYAKAKEALDRRVLAARKKTGGANVKPMAAWVVHDLRRTCATRMADLGVLPHVIEAALNHVSGHKAGIAGVYNRSTYEREVKTALALWADYVRSLVSGGDRKVVPLRAQS